MMNALNDIHDELKTGREEKPNDIEEANSVGEISPLLLIKLENGTFIYVYKKDNGNCWYEQPNMHFDRYDEDASLIEKYSTIMIKLNGLDEE